MRILAIRGENLASLRRFEVDLDDPDGLGATGLFAITGPTGAGKSTLLDALCLALYDKTPRFDRGRSGHKVGRDPNDPDNLGASDVRNILRRGAGAGFAEVDFVGRDAGQYRARWIVRRAYGRADRRLQSQTMTLTDLLDGQVLSGATKSETLGIIEDRTGLSFDQFRRSVLLAQGDFDAFLRAPIKERGALLERMTGTEIYARISIAAHTRARDARHAVQRIEDQLSGYAVLTEPERAALDDELTRIAAWQAAGRQRQDAVQSAVRWHATHLQLQSALRSAQANQAATHAADQAAEADRTRLDAIRKAAPIRPEANALERAVQAVETRRHRLQNAQSVVDEATHALRQADAARHTAIEARDGARAAGVAAEPAIARARALDAQIEALQATRKTAEHAVEATRTEHAALQQRYATLAAERADLHTAMARAQAQQATHAEWAQLHADWPALKAAAHAWIVARDGLQSRRDAYRAAQQAVRTADAHEQTLAARLAEVETAWATADAALRTAETALADADLQRAQQTRQRHADAARDLEVLLDRAQSAAQLRTRRNAIETRLTATKKRRTRCRSSRTKADRRLSAAQAAHDHAQQALQLSRAVADLASHRAQLKPGEPCPVCGASTHPGIDPEWTRADVFEETARVCALELDAAEAALNTARVELADAEARLDADTQALARHAEATHQLLDAWAMARMRVGGGVPEHPDAPDVLSTRKTLRDQTWHARDAAADAVKAAVVRAQARDAAHADMRRVQDARQTAYTALEDARAATRKARSQLEHIEAQGAEARDTLAGLKGQIEPLVRRLGAEVFESDPAAAIGRIDAHLHAWTAAGAALAHAQAALDASAQDWTRLEASRQAKAAQLAVVEADAKTAAQAHDAAEAERARLLDGQSTQSFADRLSAAIRVTEAQVEDAQTRRQAAQHTQGTARAAQAAAQQGLDDARQAETDARARLQSACATAGLTLEAARTLLGHAPAWIEAEHTRLNTVRTQAEQARAVARERQADLNAHRAITPAVDDAAVAEAESQRLDRQLHALHRLQVHRQARQARDTDAQTASAQLQAARVAADAEKQLWGRLDALIGSSEGDAFRQFAQSLTLDAVIAQANHHLKTLARRYRLMRVPGEDLALQIIDRHMGDEVRTVKSLSGGETFLVSLALALGLASLSAQDTRIESLFIDEGFGTLDTDTLDVVLDALDALQAAGRQIGLISHVPGLAQRIGVQVCVEPTTSGMSTVRVDAGWGA